MEELQQPILRVILVEDSPLLCEMLSEMLVELDGVDVVAHAAGEDEALEALEQRRPDLAIIDLELKQGTGLGVLQAMHDAPERFGNPRAVVFSNHGHRIVRARCSALGVEHFFDKSYQLDELIEYVQAARAAH
jgi:DNA-binding NarL/FixJ family response regulator